jgi:hypothetical protein
VDSAAGSCWVELPTTGFFDIDTSPRFLAGAITELARATFPLTLGGSLGEAEKWNFERDGGGTCVAFFVEGVAFASKG